MVKIGPFSAIVAALTLTSGVAAADVAIELNKLESQDGTCRAYVVIRNDGEEFYTKYRLDLFVFGKDGVILNRYGVGAAPVRPKKTVIKAFDMAGVDCAAIGHFTLSDFLECAVGDADQDSCIDAVMVSSKAAVELRK